MGRYRLLIPLFAALAWIMPSRAESILQLALPELPAKLNPHQAVRVAEHILARELFVGLVTYDAAGNLVPGLAESWTVSADGRTYAFILRSGLEWSDGKQIDATTIVKGFEHALDPAHLVPFVAQLLIIKNADLFRLGTLPHGEVLGVIARDRRTVEIQLIAPSQRFLHVLAQPLAAPLPLHRIAELQDAWASPFIVTGNGPFMISPRGDRYALKRNPRFFDARNVISDRIDIDVIATVPRALDAVQHDKVALALGFAAEPHDSRTKDRGLMTGDILQTYSLLMNTSQAPFDKREVRHALGMAIDRDDLIKSHRLTDAQPAYNVVPAPAYSPYRAPYAKLEPAARRIVAEALLLDTDAHGAAPIRFAHPVGKVHAALAESIAKTWKELGFAVDLIARADADHEQAVLNGDFDVAVAPDWRSSTGVEAYLFPFSQGAGPWHAARYRELEFDERLVAADIEINQEHYLSQLREAEGVLIEDQAVWPMFFYPAAVIASEAFPGLVVNTSGIHPLRFIAPPSH